VNEEDGGVTVARGGGDSGGLARGGVKPEAGKVGHIEKRGISESAKAVGFFGGCGRTTDGNVLAVRLLDGGAGKLGTMLINNIVEIREGLDFIE
jgi:hypothetical protein